MTTARLGVGPMSTETIIATYRFSHEHRQQMMLIASLNQINCNGGYVNGWDTATFKQFCMSLKRTYPDADVLLCRDHCGPYFMGEDNLTTAM